MLRRSYKVLGLICALTAVAVAQTAVVRGTCEVAGSVQAAETPTVPPPILPEIISSSLAMLAPVSASAEPGEGFAYQSSEAAPLVFDVAGGSYLGVYLDEVTHEKMKELGLKEERGAIVMKVVKDSPAEKAGLKENDVVVGFNGRRVDSVREFQRLLNDTPADRTVTIEILRGDSKETLSATLTKRHGLGFGMAGDATKQLEKTRKQFEDAHKDFQYRGDLGNFNFVFPDGGLFGNGRLGVSVESLTDQLAGFFAAKEGGLLVTEVTKDSPAERAGIKAGDVITSVDGEKVKTVSGLINAINKKAEGQISIQVIRDRVEKTVTATLEKKSVRRRTVPSRSLTTFTRKYRV